MPYGVWGRVKGSVGDIGLSAKVETSSGNLNTLGLNVQATAPSGTTMQVAGVAKTDKPSVSIGNVQVTQTVDTNVGTFAITPKYNLDSGSANVKLAYGRDDTSVTIDANADSQKVTVSQAFGGKNLLTPSITSDGDVEVQYKRSIGSGAATVAVKPGSHVGVTYEDGPWVATVTADLDGLAPVRRTPYFSVRRAVDVTAFGL